MAAIVEQLEEEELEQIYHIPIPKQTNLPISYNVAPSHKVLTIRFNPETSSVYPQGGTSSPRRGALKNEWGRNRTRKK